jgi:hypothetical protein
MWRYIVLKSGGGGGGDIINNRKQPSKRNCRNMYWREIVIMLPFFITVVHWSSRIILMGRHEVIWYGDVKEDARAVGHLCNLSHMEAIRLHEKCLKMHGYLFTRHTMGHCAMLLHAKIMYPVSGIWGLNDNFFAGLFAICSLGTVNLNKTF